MSRLIRLLDRFFNRLYSSKYNPIYASGSIALGLFSVVLITGLYLSFFYRLGEPYESVAALSRDPWFGSWIRTVHRSASDLMVVSVLFHLLRMIVQGKAWGPRTLAWVTGVGLAFLMFISGWTGYVMVWDAQAQALAMAGARVFDALGLFPDPIVRSFSGADKAPASFFFLNLFLHVAIPLGMVFGVWAHTSRIARADWLPNRRILFGMSAVLILAALIWPAPLGSKADLLRPPAEYPTDWIFNFWISWAEWSPLFVFAFFMLGGALLAAAPWYLRPKGKKNPSFNDPNICIGCSQCAQDCPYEAIQMVSMEVSSRMKTVAQVDPALCVSCGLCSASCEPMTIGPEGRKAGNQVRAARAFLGTVPGVTLEQTLIVGCRNQAGVLARLRKSAQGVAGFQIYPVDCPGTLHSVVYSLLAHRFSRVVIASCPARNCANKDGHMLLTERISGRREPSPVEDAVRNKIRVFQVGEGEESTFFRNLRRGEENSDGARKFLSWRTRISAVLASLVAVFLVAVATRVPASSGSENGLLRLSVRLVGQNEKTCREPTPEETAKLPRHMRTAEVCTYRALSYRLKLRIDGEESLDEPVHPGGFKGDRPLYVSREFELSPGPHEIKFSMEPVDPGGSSAVRLGLDRTVDFHPGRVVLIHSSPDERSVILKEGRP